MERPSWVRVRVRARARVRVRVWVRVRVRVVSLQVEQAQVCGRVEEAAHGVEGRLDDRGARQVEGGVEHERHAW